MTSGLVRTAIVMLLGVATIGCFSKAKQQHQTLDNNYVLVQGRVDWQPPVEGPVVVSISLTSNPGSAVQYNVLEKPRNFRFRVPPGSFTLRAVEDADRDFFFRSGERGVEISPPELLNLKGGMEVTDLVVELVDGSSLETTGSVNLQSIAMVKGQELSRSLLNTGLVVDLDDDRFSKEWAEKGISAPLDFLTEIGAGAYLLEPYDKKRIPVLFVHGAEGSPRDFTQLINRLDAERFQPIVFHYPSGFSLRGVGRFLNDVVEELRVRYGFRRLYVVAHSMGGLVAKSFIMRNSSNGNKYIKKFVTISTPWAGHSLAALGVKVVGDAVPAWQDMSPGSPFLESLFAEPLSPSIRHCMLFSYKGGSMMVGGADDGAVSLTSQLVRSAQEGATKVFGYNENHTSILASQAVADQVNGFLR